MRVAVVGSRTLYPRHLEEYLPPDTTEIVSGGAKGVDRAARTYALQAGLALTEFLPNYRRYGRGAPFKRNQEIVRHADFALIFWDGSSRGTQHVITLCQASGLPFQVIRAQAKNKT